MGDNDMSMILPEIANVPIVYGHQNAIILGIEKYIEVSDTSTIQLPKFELTPDLVPFDYSRSSGALDFWDDPTEDIYTFDNGQPI